MNYPELKNTSSRNTRFLVVLQYVVFISLILYLGRQVFVPLAFAALISFVLQPICAWMERKGVSRLGAIAISMGFLMSVALLLTILMVKQVVNFAGEWSTLQSRISSALTHFSEYLSGSLGISFESQGHWLSEIRKQMAGGAMKFAKDTISISTFSMVMLVLVPVYATLILYYRRLWKNVLVSLFRPEAKDRVENILHLAIAAYYNFIKGMGLVYLIVGLLNSLGLLLLGVPHAFLFGFIASVLTFIPYVGIIVGALLPVTIAWAIHDSIWYPLGVVGVFAFVQYLEANVIFPFAVSGRLKVNTLVVLVAIFLGGVLWGVSGMILFVPFVGIAKIIADADPQLKTISMLLGTGDEKTKSNNPLKEFI